MNRILAFMIFLIIHSQAGAIGNEIGNGGDAIAAQFISTGQFLKDNWSALRIPRQLNITAEAFSQVLKVTVIETRDKVEIEGREVDAMNLPAQKRIVVNRKRWISMVPVDRLTIALHEYLGLMTDADRNFEITPDALKGLSPQVDVLARITSLLITSVEIQASPSCSNLIGHWKTCAVESSIQGLEVSDLSIRQSSVNGSTRYTIESNIGGITATSAPGGAANGEFTRTTCADSILNMDYIGPSGEVLSHAEWTMLGMGDIYAFLEAKGLGSVTIRCE